MLSAVALEWPFVAVFVRLNFKHIRMAQQRQREREREREIGLLGNLSFAVQDGREELSAASFCAVKTSKGRSATRLS